MIFPMVVFCLDLFFFYVASQLRREMEALGDALVSMQKQLEWIPRSHAEFPHQDTARRAGGQDEDGE